MSDDKNEDDIEAEIKDEIDWEKLTRQPFFKKTTPRTEEEPVRHSIDWSLLNLSLTRERLISKRNQSNSNRDSQKEEKEQQIDWAKLTKPPKR